MSVANSVLVAALVFVILVACSSPVRPSESSSGSQGSGVNVTAPVAGALIVSAASSLRVPFEKIGKAYERAHPGVEVRFNFDSSGTLARQIIDGAPSDVFASADAPTMQTVVDRKLIVRPVSDFARNRLAIVVKPGNPTNINSLRDLSGARTVALCGREVPCGAYADRILARAGVTISADRITRGQSASATFTSVAEGDADAGIVYATDIVADRGQAVIIPDPQNVVAVYPIGIVQDTQNPAAAQAFIDAVSDPAGQLILSAAGFLTP